MSKKACKKKHFEDKQDAQYYCKKCKAKVNNKNKVCKPKKNEGGEALV